MQRGCLASGLSSPVKTKSSRPSLQDQVFKIEAAGSTLPDKTRPNQRNCKMLDWFTSRSRYRRKAEELYGAVVAAARQPALFSQGGIPDTPEGRFEAVALFLFLAVDRLQREGADGERMGQRLIEVFVTDMDDNLREMGVGDLSVPKKVQRATNAFYERALAYRAGLKAADSDELAAALTQFVYKGSPSARAGQLGHYVRNVAARLAQIPSVDASAGQLTFLPFHVTEAIT